MKNRKNVLIKIILFIILITNSTLVSATNQEYSFNASATCDKKNVKPGEEVTILVEVSDINMGNNGINTVEGMIKYDENVVEEIKKDSLKAQDGWTVTYNDEASTLNGKFLAVNLSTGIKENTKLFSIKLKIKSDVTKSTETNIQIKDITSNNGEELITTEDKNIKLNIEVKQEEKPENNVKENVIENPVQNKTDDIKNVQDTGKTTATNRIPNAGLKSTIIFLIVIAIIAVIVFAIKNDFMKGIK